MIAQRKTTLLTPLVAIAAILVLLFGAYMGSYYAILEDVGVELLEPRTYGPTHPIYRVNYADRLLESAHQIDRLLRPTHWESDPYTQCPLPNATNSSAEESETPSRI